MCHFGKRIKAAVVHLNLGLQAWAYTPPGLGNILGVQKVPETLSFVWFGDSGV
jgi:hypothetical protein